MKMPNGMIPLKISSKITRTSHGVCSSWYQKKLADQIMIILMSKIASTSKHWKATLARTMSFIDGLTLRIVSRTDVYLIL